MIKVGITGGGRGKIVGVDEATKSLLVTVVPPPLLQSNSFGKIALGGATSGTLNPIRFTPYFEQTTAAQRSLLSTSALDTAAGTGARQVKITYFDNLLRGPFTTIRAMAGLAAAATTVMDVAYVEKFEVIEVGSAGTNQGTITLAITAAGVGVIGTIATGVGVDARTYWAHHYVAADKKFQVGAIDCGATAAAVNAEAFLTYANPLQSGTYDEQVIGSLAVGQNSPADNRNLTPQFQILGPAKITLKVIPSGNNGTFVGSFDWSEEPIAPADRQVGNLGGPNF